MILERDLHIQETLTEIAVDSTALFKVEGLHCIGCTQKIILALDEKYSGSRWAFSMATGILEGVGLSQPVLRFDVQNIVDRYESDVYVLPNASDEVNALAVAPSKDLASWLKKRTTRISIGAFVLTTGLLLELFNPGNISLMPSFTKALLFVAYLFVGTPVIKRAVSNILKGEWFDENFLMSIATFGAIALGELPEALGVMLFYELGEHFQGKAVDQSRRAIEKLLAIRPDKAHLVVGDKMWDVPSSQLAIGDVLLVKPGERIPTDAILLSEQAFVDTSSMTGESKPVHILSGERVLGGFINLQQAMHCRVEKPFLESTASRLIQLVQQAADKKAKPEQFMTKFAKVYTPIVILLSLVTAILPPLVLGDPFSVWIYRALIFLVISCPCALVISIPLSYFGGIGAASKMGVLVKGGNYLEALSQLSSVYFDKTGTLTEGTFEVREVMVAPEVTRDRLLYWASMAEQNSNHPIGIAIRKAAAGLEVHEDHTFKMLETAGEGIHITKEGVNVFVGKQSYILEKLDRRQLANAQMIIEQIGRLEEIQTSTIVHVLHNHEYLGAIVLRDEVKSSSADTVIALNGLGIDVAMLSGDRSETVDALAKQLKIPKAYGDLKPKDKLTIMEQAMDKYASKAVKGKIAFVGDGINDAPVIARADIGIAMGGIGSEAAIEAADIVLMRDEPEALIGAIHLANRTRGIVFQNIVMALGIKVVFMGLGMTGLSGMWEAIFADVGVALLAVLNAMRLIPKD